MTNLHDYHFVLLSRWLMPVYGVDLWVHSLSSDIEPYGEVIKLGYMNHTL